MYVYAHMQRHTNTCIHACAFRYSMQKKLFTSTCTCTSTFSHKWFLYFFEVGLPRLEGPQNCPEKILRKIWLFHNRDPGHTYERKIRATHHNTHSTTLQFIRMYVLQRSATHRNTAIHYTKNTLQFSKLFYATSWWIIAVNTSCEQFITILSEHLV